MHADVMPDEAAAMTVLALADLHDAAGQAGVPWTLMLDEFGAVIKMAASRAVAILQRGRSHGGQVIVVTQSVADPEALSGQAGLVPSLTDNFSGIVAHHQTAPESRDWLAELRAGRGDHLHDARAGSTPDKHHPSRVRPDSAGAGRCRPAAPCELSVHPEKRLPAAAGPGAGGGDVGPDPHAADF
jgi:hypothetical protein